MSSHEVRPTFGCQAKPGAARRVREDVIVARAAEPEAGFIKVEPGKPLLLLPAIPVLDPVLGIDGFGNDLQLVLGMLRKEIFVVDIIAIRKMARVLAQDSAAGPEDDVGALFHGNRGIRVGADNFTSLQPRTELESILCHKAICIGKGLQLWKLGIILSALRRSSPLKAPRYPLY